MELQGVYHRSSDNYCYALDENNLIINLKTGQEVSKVFLHYGDPFTNGILGSNSTWEGKREEIVFKKRLAHHNWWTTTVQPPFKRCRYYFELICNEEVIYYFEDGFYTLEDLEEMKGQPQYFTFPWMNKSDINTVPKWVNDTIWYQIFPERFCNGDASLNKEGTLSWAGPQDTVKNNEFYGGDLRGIIEKLPYLKSLHISGIYLTPINESPSTHKYDTIDYFKIDPYFGDEETMKELVEKAHALGIKVMLDGVFNHAGAVFPKWQDVVEKGPNSKYYDWFMVNEWPFDPRGNNAHEGRYFSFAFNDKMPKFNTNNEVVQEYLISICEYWVNTYQIDGIRLDVANEVSHSFCKALRRRLKAIKQDLYILGEIWNDAISWLRGDEFDAVMNYPLGETITDFWLNQEETSEKFEALINRCYTLYMQQTNDVLFNLLDSHDTARLMHRIQNKDKMYQQILLLLAMPGSPCIFYGTEVLLDGAHDPDCRRCMPWKEIEEGLYKEEMETIQTLLQLRLTEPLFKSRNFHFTHELENSRVLEFLKIDDYNQNKLKIILNCSENEIEVPIEGQVMYSRYLKVNKLGKNGILIIKKLI
nr:glycoside hydrolase family 13 protein [uncultured Cellulosilyticum sp.]